MSVWTQMNRARTSGIWGALLLLMLTQVAQAAPASAPALNLPTVAGPLVTLTWSPVPGATGYRLSVGTAPGTEGYAYAVGAVTSVTLQLAIRRHRLRARAGLRRHRTRAGVE